MYDLEDYGYNIEEKPKPKPTEKQIKKFCEANLCKHCFYHDHRSCKLHCSYFSTSEFCDYKLVNVNCFTAKIKPEKENE